MFEAVAVKTLIIINLMYLQYSSQDFKRVVFASIVFDVYLQINDVLRKLNIPYLEKV